MATKVKNPTTAHAAATTDDVMLDDFDVDRERERQQQIRAAALLAVQGFVPRLAAREPVSRDGLETALRSSGITTEQLREGVERFRELVALESELTKHDRTELAAELRRWQAEADEYTAMHKQRVADRRSLLGFLQSSTIGASQLRSGLQASGLLPPPIDSPRATVCGMDIHGNDGWSEPVDRMDSHYDRA